MSVTRQTPQTRSGLLAEARHVVLPAGITASGFPRIKATAAEIGVEFDPWQQDLNKCLLAKTADGMYAADTAVISIPRQVGKTFDIGAVVFAECIASPGTTVVWTAHRFKVSRETFNELRALAKSPKLSAHIDYDQITTAAGNETIPFRNGSRIVFAARERGAIRGFSKVRILVLDEAQILTEATLADLTPTMNQAVNPLIILMGTPPKPTDPGEAFTNLRADALAGESEGVLYVEFSAESRYAKDLDNREGWKQANPSFPRRTPARAVQRMRKLLSDDDFRREALGIWDSDGHRQVIPAEKWDAICDRSAEPPRPTGLVAFAVHCNIARDRASIAVAGKRPDGMPQVQVIESRGDVAWTVARLVELHAAWPNFGVVVDKGSSTASLLDELEAARIPVIEMNTGEAKQAFGQFYDACIEGTVRHLNQSGLNAALRAAPDRIVGGARLWDEKGTDVDITPLVAATNALWGWTTRQGTGELQIF